MNEIRQLCTTSSSPDKHLDEILALFNACPPQHLLSSLSLIGQSISCMSIEQLDINIVNHQIFLILRQWSERLLQLWLVNGTLNGNEYRAMFYIHQLFKLLSEWLIEQDNIACNNKNKDLLKSTMNDLFIEENFINTLCRIINQLIKNENDEQSSLVTSHVSDDEDHLSPDDIQLQTETSDIQAEQADVIDVLFRCVNCLLNLYSHRILINNSVVHENLTPCIINCLNTPLFIQLSTEFLRQNMTSDKINIRSIFLLFTCLDYCTVSTKITSTLQILASVNKIFHIWCEMPQNSDDDISFLIIRLIAFVNQLVLVNKEAIIRENICASLLPHFEILCQTPNLIDDISSLLVTICSTKNGKRHLRHLGFVQHILYETKRCVQLWHPLSLLLTQHDLYQTSLFKRLIHLLIQRTINIFQSLASTSNDTSFDSTSPSSKNQIATTAIEWFALLRSSFLSFSTVVDELIVSTKKVNIINTLIDTILFIEQDDDISPKLLVIMVEVLWTFSFSTSTNIHDNLQQHVNLCRWLKSNITDSIPSVRIASQAVLFTLDSNTKNLIRATGNRGSTTPKNILICIFNADESHHELCVTLRDRLQLEQQYSVELIVTPKCQSIDALIPFINRSSLCLFCASTKMKNDNLSHFLYHYISIQTQKIPLLRILIEYECELEGNWLENIPIVDIQSIFKEIRRYLNPTDDTHTRISSRASLISSVSNARNRNPDVLGNQPNDYTQLPVSYWSADDVSQWCESAENKFDTLRPLVTRLNGPALVNLAEIISIEPASMYHCLNDELQQRTGLTVPLTEYVSLQSELQHLLKQTPNGYLIANSIDNNLKRKKCKNSRFCSLF
ncbi:unnamed protein product [Rotaria magnacalcarata]|uniref:Uncharacterized protein n=1 Tax=Rotaria magnacalcarata TaxID=392030 RepID=A0A816UWR4_9BILA|nr:unnamed protein product [Rotaria magnacalcarata]CAF2112752.1 unnamed protein product [Rotaria magnacalcarata]CAF4211334.1 unnamed protein product [Rotaria magnacalcarata]CAF4233546.1 unnamed protein product [Rotaria magnacalcarata]